MYSSEPNARNADLSLSTSDIYRAAGEGVILMADAERLVKWGYEQRFRDPLSGDSLPLEQRKGFNLVTVAYYFGAMLMISACAWFLGDKWSVIGSGGIFATVFIYMLIAVSVGWWVRSKGFIVGGGLLITVAVCLVPLLTYTIEVPSAYRAKGAETHKFVSSPFWARSGQSRQPSAANEF